VRARCRHAATATALLAILAGCRSAVLAPPAPPHAAVPPPPVTTVADEFVLTFWCGPPLLEFTDQRAAEIAAAGFNVIGATCEGAFNPALNQRALDIAARHGLRIILKDKRLSAHEALTEGWQQAASEAIAEYRDHPGLAGFFLVDEPGPERFTDIAALTRRIHREAPGAIAYVNLLPDYAVEEALHDYREYVEEFVFRVRPRLLSYDHYAFLDDGSERPSFFANLETVRDISLEYQVPFLFVFLAMPHGPYRDPSEAEMRWQAFQALAFGARGLSYFAYWTPVGVGDGPGMRFRHGLIEGGVATRHYFEAQRINAAASAVAALLRAFHPVAAASGDLDRVLPPDLRVGGDPVTAGLFRNDLGETAVLLVNRRYDEPAHVHLQALGEATPRLFDPQAQRWTTWDDSPTIPPGAALLLRW